MKVRPLQKIAQHQAYQIVFWQLLSVLLIAVFALLLSTLKNSFSILAGGFAYVIPNLIFVWRVFRYAGANEMQRFMLAFFFGEMGKLIFSALLFIVVVKYLPVSLLSVLIGFIGAIVSFWFVCLMQFSKRKGVVNE